MNLIYCEQKRLKTIKSDLNYEHFSNKKFVRPKFSEETVISKNSDDSSTQKQTFFSQKHVNVFRHTMVYRLNISLRNRKNC